MALKYKDIGCIYTFFGWMTVGLYREAAGGICEELRAECHVFFTRSFIYAVGFEV